MSILCVQIPGFLLQIAYQAMPELLTRPTALLNPQDRVCALNPAAHMAGVMLQMRPQQALACCPGLALLAADLDQALVTQSELLATLMALELPTEEHGWGRAYLDLHTVSQSAGQVQETASVLGKTVRRSLGDALTPALGGSVSKFTARAAAAYTTQGRIKLVEKADEPRFLAPLPTRLLPLSSLSLQELSWLDILTLGKFAQLPVQSVVQRYGAPGRIAHQWARGLDNRPVRPTTTIPTAALACTFDPPIATLDPVVAALHATLQPQIIELRHSFCGVRKLLLSLTFFGDETRALSSIFVEPIGDLDRLMQHLRAKLEALNWPQALERIEIKRLEVGELVVEQATLFDAPRPTTLSLPELAQRLLARYGKIFWQARAIDRSHPFAEQRFLLDPLA